MINSLEEKNRFWSTSNTCTGNRKGLNGSFYGLQGEFLGKIFYDKI